MADDIVLQPIKEEQKGQIIDVAFGGTTERQRFLKRLAFEDAKYTSEFKPFAYKAAKEDYEKAQAETWDKKKSHFTAKGIKFQDDVPIDLNLSQYGDLKDWKLERKTPVKEFKLQDGMRVEHIANEYHEWKHKSGFRKSILVPNNADKKR